MRIRRQNQLPRRGPGWSLGRVGGALLLLSATSAWAQDGDIKLAPSAIQFGRVTEAKTRVVKIQNKGRAQLVVDGIVRCTGTSDEFTFSPESVLVEAKKSADLRVTYSPDDAGDDEGCLEISSSDPDDPVVRLRLSGAGRRSGDDDDDSDDAGDDAALRLRPDSLDFGRVAIGSGKAKTFLMQTTGGASFDVTVAPCVDTSVEFGFTPDQLTVRPGRGSEVEVAYRPIDAGVDEGCLALAYDPNQEPLLLDLEGAGVEEDPDESEIDIDIHDFKVKKESRLKAAQPVGIRLWVRNEGTQDGPAPAAVVGTQNEEIVYEHTFDVSDRPGNEGVSKYSLPPFTPVQSGDIVWTATIEDDDPDEDTATAVTRVLGDPDGDDGVDLDIRRFRVTSSLSLSTTKEVKIRLAVENNGDLDEEREATLVGVQDGVEIYFETLLVSDPTADRGATNFRFPTFVPDSVGEIVWLVVLDDDADDRDEAFAVTRVLP